MIIFYYKQQNLLKEKIKTIIIGREKEKNQLIKEKEQNFKPKKIKKRKIKNTKINLSNSKSNINIDSSYLNQNNSIKIKNFNKNPPKKIKVKQENNIISKNDLDAPKIDSNLNQKNIEIIETSSMKNKNILNNEKIIEKTKEILVYSEQELNNLPYNLALINDERSYCEYYFSLLKTQHVLIFSFFYNKDYNSKIIKIDLFFISFVIYFTINAIFFNDDTIHKIYIDKGKFGFIYQLPQIIYSSLISIVLNMVLKILALVEKDILQLKNNKDTNNLIQNGNDLYKKLQIKSILFFIFSSIFLLFFWYYLSLFCAIYKSTQTHLIKDTLISFSLSLLYPFGIYMLPGIFRIPSLSNKEKNRYWLYVLSKILQLF